MKKVILGTVAMMVLSGSALYADQSEYPRPICYKKMCVYENQYGKLAFPKVFEKADKFLVSGIARTVSEGYYQFIDISGNIVISGESSLGNSHYAKTNRESAVIHYSNSEYLGWNRTRATEYYYFIYNNKLIQTNRFYDAYPFASNGLALVQVKEGSYSDKMCTYINQNFQVILDLPYKYCSSFDDNHGLASVGVNDNIGFINSKGQFIIEPVLGGVSGKFSKDGTIFVKFSSGKYGIVNTKGDTKVLGSLSSYDGYSLNGLAEVHNNGKHGFINSKGELSIPLIYEYAEKFADNGLALVKKNGKYGYINSKGKFVIPAIYERANTFEDNGLAIVTDEVSTYFIDSNGKKYDTEITKALKYAANKEDLLKILGY